MPIIFQRKNKDRKANPRGAGYGLLTQRSLRLRRRGFWMLDVFPRLRDALTRGFLIGEEIAHAKPRQECGVEPLRPRRCGFRMFPRGCGTRSRVDFIFLIREKIAHAKAAKGAKDGKGKVFNYFPKLRDARDVVLE